MKQKIVIHGLYASGLALLLACQVAVGTDIGSDTTVNRFNTQQTLTNVINRIAGFAAIQGGFKLATSAVQAYFDCFFPVTGSIEVNGGNLVLSRDLIFYDSADIKSLGTISGNFHTLEFSDTVTWFPSTVFTSNTYTFSNLTILLNSDVTFKSANINFKGSNAIIGNGNYLTLDATSNIFVDTGSQLLLQDITVKDVSGTQLSCRANNSALLFKNATLALDGNFTFTKGYFVALQDFTVTGSTYNFAYQTDQISTVSLCATMKLDMGVTFSYNPSIANRDLLQFIDKTAQLMLNGATLYSTTTGLRLTKGTVFVESRSYLSSDATVDAQAISFGDGISASNNIDLHWLPAANFEILRGRVLYNNV